MSAGSGGKYLGGTPTNPTLTVTTTEISDAGEYYCTATNTIGTVESPAVELRVISEFLSDFRGLVGLLAKSLV